MEAKSWKLRITNAMKEAGTYQPFFDEVITTLAGIMNKRDDAEDFYIKTGGRPIVKHTNKGGNSNLEQNPALRLINDLNRDALQYWRELGLTPAGLKKIIDDSMKNSSASPLDKVLESLEKQTAVIEPVKPKAPATKTKAKTKGKEKTAKIATIKTVAKTKKVKKDEEMR